MADRKKKKTAPKVEATRKKKGGKTDPLEELSTEDLERVIAGLGVGDIGDDENSTIGFRQIPKPRGR